MGYELYKAFVLMCPILEGIPKKNFQLSFSLARGRSRCTRLSTSDKASKIGHIRHIRQVLL